MFKVPETIGVPLGPGGDDWEGLVGRAGRAWCRGVREPGRDIQDFEPISNIWHDQYYPAVRYAEYKFVIL